jgi:hypothetical protein
MKQPLGWGAFFFLATIGIAGLLLAIRAKPIPYDSADPFSGFRRSLRAGAMISALCCLIGSLRVLVMIIFHV